MPLCASLRSCFGKCSGISFMGSTAFKVCHDRRIKQHKVFEDSAARGKTSVVFKVCHDRRIKQHKVLEDLAARGKTSVVHLIQRHRLSRSQADASFRWFGGSM